MINDNYETNSYLDIEYLDPLDVSIHSIIPISNEISDGDDDGNTNWDCDQFSIEELNDIAKENDHNYTSVCYNLVEKVVKKVFDKTMNKYKDEIFEKIDCLAANMGVQNYDNHPGSTNLSRDKMQSRLPVTKIDDLKALEYDLKKDSEIRQDLVSFLNEFILSSYSGDSCDRICRSSHTRQ